MTLRWATHAASPGRAIAPRVIVHLKQGIEADVPATARVITDPDEARPLIEAAARRWRRDDVDDMIAHSPLIVLTAAPPHPA